MKEIYAKGIAAMIAVILGLIILAPVILAAIALSSLVLMILWGAVASIFGIMTLGFWQMYIILLFIYAVQYLVISSVKTQT